MGEIFVKYSPGAKEVIKRINDKIIKKIENYNYKENSFDVFYLEISNLYKRELNILNVPL